MAMLERVTGSSYLQPFRPLGLRGGGISVIERDRYWKIGRIVSFFTGIELISKPILSLYDGVLNRASDMFYSAFQKLRPYQAALAFGSTSLLLFLSGGVWGDHFSAMQDPLNSASMFLPFAAGWRSPYVNTPEVSSLEIDVTDHHQGKPPYNINEVVALLNARSYYERTLRDPNLTGIDHSEATAGLERAKKKLKEAGYRDITSVPTHIPGR